MRVRDILAIALILGGSLSTAAVAQPEREGWHRSYEREHYWRHHRICRWRYHRRICWRRHNAFR